MGNCFNFFTEMPTEKYAEMLARTTRTETQNIAMIGKALDDGNDLVECSTVTPTCDLCALYQGRIYSVSGRTPGYPSLYETAFKHGYSIIHPNCRHQFFPYNPKFHTEAERQALEEGTRRPWIGGQQGEAARAEYAKSQMQMRRWNKELNEFAQMKQRFGDNAPYKTLGAFRRAYRSEEGTLAYAKSHYYRSDEKEFKEFESVIGKENMPETLEKFQELKYNKDKQRFTSLQVGVADEKVRRKLGSAELPLTIQADKQGRHIKGHKNFTDDKSYLAVETIEEGLKLSWEIVEKYHGKGKLIYNKNKENIKEKVETDIIVGYVFSKQCNKWVATKVATIHYSKNGTHIVPAIINKGD